MKLTRIKAFSLAEILVVITIIGLVVALTAPALYENYMQRHYETAKKVFVSDIRSAVKKMHADDELAGYGSTVEFAGALSKYLKIRKICGPNSYSSYSSSYGSVAGFSSCFVSEFENGSDNGRCLSSGCYSTSGTVYLSSFQSSYNFGKSYNTNNAGIVTEKGVSAILTYDPRCEESEETETNIDGIPCVGVMFDANGDEPPNKVGYDIGLLNAGYILKVASPSSSGSSSSGSGTNNNSNNNNQNTASTSGNTNNNSNNNQSTSSTSGSSAGSSGGSGAVTIASITSTTIQNNGGEYSFAGGYGPNVCPEGHVPSYSELKSIFPAHLSEVEAQVGKTFSNPDTVCFHNTLAGYHGYLYAVTASGGSRDQGCTEAYIMCVK